MKLLDIQKILSSDYDTRYEEKTDDVPLDSLLVLLNEEKDLVMKLLFIPTGGQAKEIRLLQMSVNLDIKVDDIIRPEFRRLLLFLNANTVLGGFGFDEDSGCPYYRYILATSKSGAPLRGDALLEVVSLAHYFCEEFGQLIGTVADGTRTASSIIASMQKL